ncbi:hypothetical protein IFM89_002482 [Coptis chinensis]|uniref:GCK domain-containing protein n=1 Tax=Coptis chinensis TaxID=261450 RepID=A0A835LQP2_9MAGN|nr:hypothetical protein IFM89_002482 [Coptis chinensis]
MGPALFTRSDRAGLLEKIIVMLEAEEAKEDIAEKCYQVTAALKTRMEAHPDYYEPILRAEKVAEQEAMKELEKKAKKNWWQGPVVDEVALVEHLKENPMFRVGLDVFEDEPYMKPAGLADMKNVVVVPHIASASKWTREGMATLAALNVLGKIKGYPVWSNANNVEPFLNENSPPPAASPSNVNAKTLGLCSSKKTLFCFERNHGDQEDVPTHCAIMRGQAQVQRVDQAEPSIHAERGMLDLQIRPHDVNETQNKDVTEAIFKVAAAYDYKIVEGLLNHQLKQFVIDGNKVILSASNPETKVDDAEYEENEVYAIDIVTSTGDCKVSVICY